MPDLCGLLELLPKTFEEIEELLLAEGCAGRRLETTDCPVAKWFKKHEIDDVHVGEFLYLPLVSARILWPIATRIVWRGDFPEDLIENSLEYARPSDACILPPHVSEFINIFDRGEAHPDLYEDGY